jgi:hypothetical protein
VSSASLILTDRRLVFSEPDTIVAQGSTKVLVASSLGGCLVFVSRTVVAVALAAIGWDMHLSPACGAVAALGCTLALCLGRKNRPVFGPSRDSTWRWLPLRSSAFSPRLRCSLSSLRHTSSSSRETDPFGARNQQIGKNREETMKNEDSRKKAHEDPNHYRRHLRRLRLLDGRP